MCVQLTGSSTARRNMFFHVVSSCMLLLLLFWDFQVSFITLQCNSSTTAIFLVLSTGLQLSAAVQL